jgi:hypothetical protein
MERETGLEPATTGFSNFRNFVCRSVLNGVEMEWKKGNEKPAGD